MGAPVLVVGRSAALDAFRGLAVLAMIVDHVALFAGVVELRFTIGRLAMPAFFVLAGHLSGRLRWRHLGVAGVGLVLPLVVPWVDAPNVLLWWASGAAVLWVLDRLRVPWWVLPVVALTVYANGWLVPGTTSYEPLALWGLMCVGATVPRSSFSWAARCPRWVASIGRRPLWWYVGHLLALQLLVMGLAT